MKLYLSPFLLLLVISTPAFSQKKKEIVEVSGNRFNKEKKVYTVIKGNETIKHGPYQQYYNGKAVVTGFYKMDKKDSVWQRYYRGSLLSKKTYTENKRTGIWEFYNQDGTPWQYDFTKEIIQNRQPDTPYYSYQATNGEWIKGKADRHPVWLRSSYEWQGYLNITLRYPQGAIDSEAQGVILVDILVDENGNAIDYSIEKSVHPALDEESIRVVKLFQPEFLPAEKDGKKVKSKVRQPIVFRMETDG